MGFIFADAKILIVFGGNNSFVEEKITPFLSKKNRKRTATHKNARC
jgi:hypothetical protein